jgi:hypothetical protein
VVLDAIAARLTSSSGVAIASSQLGGEAVERMEIGASKDDILTRLTAEHRAIKERLRQLDRHISLTSAEQVEYAQLKKMKLATKDRIRALED